VRRHLGGGAPATPEVYERAIGQFNRLPGAVRTPTKASPPRPVAKPDDDKSDQAEDGPRRGWNKICSQTHANAVRSKNANLQTD